MAIKKVVEIDIKSDSKQAQSSFKSIKKDLDSVGTSAKKNLSDEGFKKITKELKNTEKAAKSTKTRLRELEDEMADIGDVGSPQFQKLAKEAGVLKDKMNNAKAAVKSMSSDFPKLQVGTQAFQAMGGAAQGAMGAMALVGGENEMVTKSIQKMMAVQSILNSVTAISNALSDETALGLKVRTSLGKIKTANDIKQAGATKGLTLAQKAMTAATWVMNGVMKIFNKTLLSNPIFWIVAIIMAAVAAFKIFGGSQEDAEASAKKLTASLEKQSAALERNKAIAERNASDRRRQLIINGASEEDLHKDTLKRLDEEQAQRLEVYKKRGVGIKRMSKKYKKALRDENNELAKSLGEKIRADRKANDDLILQKGEYFLAVQEANETEEARVDAVDDQKEAEDLAKRNTRISNWKASEAKKLQERRKILDLENSLIEDKTERALAIRKEKYNREIEDLKINEKDREKVKKLMDAKLKQDLEAINKVEEDKETAKLKEFYAKQDALEIELMTEGNEKKKAKKTAEFEAKIITLTEQGLHTNEIEKQLAQELADFKQGLDDKVKADAKVKRDKEAADIEAGKKKDLADAVAVADAKLQMASDAFGAIGDLATAFAKDDEAGAKRAFNINKGVGIAQAVVSTAQGVMAQLAVPQDALTGANFVKAGIVAATGAAQIATIAKSKFQGTGATAPPPPTLNASGSSPASFNVVGNTGINQLAQGLGGQDNVTKTFVVASDVTTAQGLDRDRMDLVTL